MGSFLSGMTSGTPAGAEASDDPPSLVVAFHKKADYDMHLAQCIDSPNLAVIYFSATWCGPCRAMEPALEHMSSKFPNVDFIKIDVDELADVAGEWKVEAMPTFVLAKRGEEVSRVVGANKDELQEAIYNHVL